MEIKNAELKYFKKGAFYSISNENIRHVKVLPYLSVVQSVEGSYDITLGNGVMEQTGEKGFFIAPAGIEQTIVHHTDKKSGKMTCRWIFIDVDINKAYKLDSLYRFPTVINNHKKDELNALFDSLFETEDIWENYSICYKVLGILMQIGTPIEKTVHQGIKNAIAYITEHYSKKITVEKLAKISNMSESNFYGAFKKYYGTAPIAYLNHYRLSVASNLLVETDHTVKEIGYEVGIKDSLYFSKLFKKTYGISPRGYRTMHKGRAMH